MLEYKVRSRLGIQRTNAAANGHLHIHLLTGL